ncbi:MAG: glycosyltransferase [Lachnospiraceae bacterium]|nr:glycosyltransferase [Lachnospiraceae bacterium]
MEKPKILFLISTLTGGGAERAVCNLSTALKDRAEIDILVNATSPYDYAHSGNVITLGMPFTKKLTLFTQLRVLFKRLSTLRRLKKTGGYDACISFMDSSNFANILSGGRHTKVVVSERIMLSQCHDRSYRLFVHPFVRLLYPMAYRVVAVSDEAGDDLVKNFGLDSKKLMTINNGLDFDYIKKMAEDNTRIYREKGAFYFMSMGRFSPQKGHWHLVRAFAALSKKHPEARLIICGAGSYLDRVKMLAHELDVDDKITFTGFCSNPYAVAARCDAFVTASRYEGFANMLLEALACGLPIISTDFPSSAREILAPDTPYTRKQRTMVEHARYGILTPVCSEEFLDAKVPLEKEEVLLARAMSSLIEDPTLRERYARMSVERAADFDIRSISGKWLEAIR